MKKIKIFSKIFFLIALLPGIVLLSSCTKKYAEINTDKNTVASIGQAELPFLFSRAIESIPWSDQVAQNLYADLYSQYFADNAPYFPTDVLIIDMDWVRNNFDPMYTDVAPQLQTIFSATNPTSAEYALCNIWWAYSFHRVTDYWGPIPYFNAGVPGTSVAYDSQDKIYDDFFKRLTAAVTVLKGKTSETPFGNFDLIYGGNVNNWIKFANTLRLRLALRISKVDPARAKTEAEAAFADGVLTTSPDDDAYAQKSLQDANRLSAMSNYNEFRMSASMESVLKGYSDPRMAEYFLPAVNTGTYEGLRNGLSIDQLALDVNKVNANSHVGHRWADPSVFPGVGDPNYLATPQIVMCTAEAYFLRAEGALLGWNMGGTATELYENGIRNSMIQWGITNSNVITKYINGITTPVAPGDYLNSPPMTTIPVKFNTSDVNVQLEQIATQKWLALFPDGMEAWADFRRNHILKLYPVAYSSNPDITNTTTQWTRRIPFLTSEKQNNGAEVEKAVGLLGGPDKITTPLWWDKN